MPAPEEYRTKKRVWVKDHYEWVPDPEMIKLNKECNEGKSKSCEGLLDIVHEAEERGKVTVRKQKEKERKMLGSKRGLLREEHPRGMTRPKTEGELNTKSDLVRYKRDEIREDFEKGMSIGEVAKKHDISTTYAWRIKNNRFK